MSTVSFVESSAFVLLVDDDADSRASLSGLLRAEGYGVEEAASGRAALDCLSGSRPKPDLILLALDMSEIDGRDFLILTLHCRPVARIPVVLLSAFRSADETLRSRVAARLVKPVSEKVLLRTIERVLASDGPSSGGEDRVE